MIEACVIMTTTNSEREAKTLAGMLVGKGMAACVQVIPKILSIYKWEGAVHEDQEYLLLIKTRMELAEAVKKAIEKNHSYEVPEFLVLPVTDGADDYLKWIEEVTPTR